MTSRTNILAPPYHVQTTAKTVRDGFPYFSHHNSISALWSRKWRMPCAAGIYPFTDGDVADFDPIFAELIKLSGDDPRDPVPTRRSSRAVPTRRPRTRGSGRGGRR